jgi:hypothetical protein
MGDESIIRIIIQGIHEKKDAEAVIKEINNYSRARGKVSVLMDLRGIERATAGARKEYIRNISTEPSNFDKLAMYGTSAVNRVMANFIIRASERKGRVRYFESEKEALKWLRE